MLTPWWAAGWVISDVVYALNFRPDGLPWPDAPPVSELRHPAAWINWRLDHWRDAHGNPLPGVSQAQRTQEEKHLAKVEAFAAKMAAADAPPTVPAYAAKGHAIFRETRKTMRFT